MVLRLSTARCTWPSDFNNSARSTVTFIATSVHNAGMTKVARRAPFGKGSARRREPFPGVSHSNEEGREEPGKEPRVGPKSRA
jgi:hypothetical protein